MCVGLKAFFQAKMVMYLHTLGSSEMDFWLTLFALICLCTFPCSYKSFWPKQYRNFHEKEWSHSTPEQAMGTAAARWHCCSNWNTRRLVQNNMVWRAAGLAMPPHMAQRITPDKARPSPRAYFSRKKIKAVGVLKHRTVSLSCPMRPRLCWRINCFYVKRETSHCFHLIPSHTDLHYTLILSAHLAIN